MLIHKSTWTVLKNLMKKNCLIKMFLQRLKDEKTGDNGKKLNGHLSDEDYFTGKIFGINLI